MRKVFMFLVMLSTGCVAIFAQISDGQLLSSEEVPSLLDSISHPILIDDQDGVRRWNRNFAYVDSLSISTINYVSDGLLVTGYVVRPKQEGIFPCIIFNRGGNRSFGALGLIQAVAMLGNIAKEGYIVIASNYRGNAGGEGQEEFGGRDVNDVLNLIPVLTEIPGADTSRIGMFGGSRGGMMTYLSLSQTSKIKAAAVLAGPTDKFAGLEDRPKMEQVLIDLVPDYIENREVELAKRSVIKWVEKLPTDVPILLMHGNADWRVKSTQSLRLAIEFEKYRIPYRLVIFEGADHGISEFRAEMYEQLFRWFDLYLRKNTPLPNMTFHGR